MYKKYYVNNIQHDGDNEVHCEGCAYLSIATNVKYLGIFASSKEAIAAAKVYYPRTADGCAHCCPEIHSK